MFYAKDYHEKECEFQVRNYIIQVKYRQYYVSKPEKETKEMTFATFFRNKNALPEKKFTWNVRNARKLAYKNVLATICSILTTYHDGTYLINDVRANLGNVYSEKDFIEFYQRMNGI